MNDLIAFTSDKKPIMKHVEKIVETMDWNDVFLIGVEGSFNKEVKYIHLDETKTISELELELRKYLKKTTFEVGINVVGGSGKMHMALFAALINSGKSLRIVAYTKKGVKEI